MVVEKESPPFFSLLVIVPISVGTVPALAKASPAFSNSSLRNFHIVIKARAAHIARISLCPNQVLKV